MSTVHSRVECKQCGFSRATKVLVLPSFEWTIHCARCGYGESWIHESYFSNDHLKKGVHEVRYSAGAYCLKTTDKRLETCCSLAESDIEETAARMRSDIVAGKLSPESYLVKFDFENHKLTAVVGRVPTPYPPEPESDLGEEACEVLGGQEDDDLSSEI